jgi:hypothetical protein
MKMILIIFTKKCNQPNQIKKTICILNAFNYY